jgi:hypothetical protein
MGGEGECIEDEDEAALPEVPLRTTRRGWTDMARRRTKGKHPIYALHASHRRSEPIESAFTGRCQSVRVRLPATPPPEKAFIGTFIGTVEKKDHLLFSIRETVEHYERAFGETKPLRRVDLVTGARFMGRRFSPVCIYLAYCDPEGRPDFYLLEGGSAQGHPEALYCARDMGATIHARSGFSFTPFACAANWYEGGLEMDAGLAEPACVYLSAAQDSDGGHAYIRLNVRYERETRPHRVSHPFELQVEAAMRVLAIAKQAGCHLGRGQGHALEPGLGPVARALMPWDHEPSGHTTAAERARYCGCPEG